MTQEVRVAGSFGGPLNTGSSFISCSILQLPVIQDLDLRHLCHNCCTEHMAFVQHVDIQVHVGIIYW